MRTYYLLLHIFAALLLCDYGMFSTPSSLSEISTTAISDTSDSNTTETTTEPIKVGNDSSLLESGSGNDQLNYLITDDPYTTKSSAYVQTSDSVHTTEISEAYSVKRNGSGFAVTFSTEQPKQRSNQKDSLTGGIVILIFILILIVLLLVILYILRKKGRSYSFDLSRVDMVANDYVDNPLGSDQQGISYEQTNKDLPVCLDYLQEDKSEEKINPIANGSAGEKTEQTPTNENDAQNVPEENSFSSDSSLDTPMKKVEFNLDLDLLGCDSDFNDPPEAEATDAEQNENNNNVSNAGQGTGEEIFTEISLDEPKEHT